MKIGNEVEIKMLNVIGEIVEVGEDSILVEHDIVRDGIRRVVKQWYSIGICSEFEDEEVIVEVEEFLELKDKTGSIELGVISEEIAVEETEDKISREK